MNEDLKNELVCAIMELSKEKQNLLWAELVAHGLIVEGLSNE